MSRSLPALMELQERFADRRDDFAILAFHDDTVKSFAELDPKLEQLERDLWNGRKLPFPILLDASRETIATYGIRSFPTTVAIGPDGHIIKGKATTLLEEHLLSTSQEVQELLEGLAADFASHLAQALERQDDAAAFALRRYAMDSATAEEVAKIAAALEKIGGNVAVQFFLDQHGLASRSKAERLSAVNALRRITPSGDHSTLKALERAASKDSDPDVRAAAREAMGELFMAWQKE